MSQFDEREPSLGEMDDFAQSGSKEKNKIVLITIVSIVLFITFFIVFIQNL